MSSQVITQIDAITPSTATRRAAAEAVRALEAPQAQPPTMHLTLAEGRSLSIPEELVGLMLSALRIAADGDAVTVSRAGQEMSTSEAAKFLGVSRPTLIKLLDDEGIGFRMAGTHRRISQKDVESYWHEQVKVRQEQALLMMQETYELELGD